MKVDEVIASLVTDLKPVRRLHRVGVRTLLWAVFALVCVCLGTHAAGTRADLPDKMQDFRFLYEGTSLLLVFALATQSAFQCSVPGIDGSARVRALPLLGMLVWLLLVAARHVAAPSATVELAGWSCVWRMIGLAFVPTLALFFMLLKAAPLEREWTGLFALLSTNALGMLGTQALCAKDEPLHILVWHGVPVVISGLTGMGLGRMFLSPSRATRLRST